VNRGLQRNVSPKTAAVVILLVLAGVQAWWWRAFIWRPRLPSGVSRGSMSGMPPGPAIELGRKDVMVETVAGALEPGYADGPGRDARFDAPIGIALGRDGRLYVADSRNHRIRVVEPDGTTSTLCGSSEGMRDGPAASAQFRYPCGVAVHEDGTVYVADTGNNRIRVCRSGAVGTLCGGVRGFAAGRGPSARFDAPVSLALVQGPSKTLIVADAGNARLRMVTLDGAANPGVACPGKPISVTGGVTWEAGVPDAATFLGKRGRLTGITTIGQGIRVGFPGTSIPLPSGERIATDATQGALLLLRGTSAEVLAGGVQDRDNMLGWCDFSGDQAQFGRIGAIAMDSRGRILVSDVDSNAIRRVTAPELVR